MTLAILAGSAWGAAHFEKTDAFSGPEAKVFFDRAVKACLTQTDPAASVSWKKLGR
jgi:hypothetical protein